MRKTIIIASLALLATTISSFASAPSKTFSKECAFHYSLTPLCNAIFRGDLETVKKFVEYGADINEASTGGVTPLMFAARYNKVEIVKYLLAKGADKRMEDARGYTAMKFAEQSNAQESLTLLKQA